MIIPLPLVVSLLLAISYATEFDYDYKLDWSRCSQDTACYIKESCLVGKETEEASKGKLVHFKGKETDMTESKCEVVIQMKALSSKKYLILMQVEVAGLKSAEGIKITQKMDVDDQKVDVDLLACKDQNTLTVLDSEIKAVYLTSNPPIFEAGKISCAILLPSTGSIYRGSKFDDSSLEGFPRLEYKLDAGDQTIQVQYTVEAPDPRNPNNFWSLPAIEQMPCNLDKVMLLPQSAGYELAEVDVSKMQFECGANNMLIKHGDTQLEVAKVECTDKKWSWSGENAGSVEPATKLKVACITLKYCMSCTTPPAEVAETECPKDECKKPTVEVVDGCKVLTCPDKKYTIDGKINQKITKPVSCNKKGEENTATWFIHDTSTPKEVPTVSCRKVETCDESGVSKGCPDGVTPCNDNIIVGKHNVTCAEADGILHNKDGPSQEGARCDTETGKWSPENPGPFYCAEEVKVEPKKEEPATGGSGAIIGAVFGIFVAIGIVGAVCYYFLVVKKKQNNTKQAGSSTKGKSSTGQSKEAKSNSNKKKDSASDNNKDSEKPKDGAAAAGDPKKPESTPATPSAAPTATPPPDAAKPAAAAPPKSDPAAPEGTTAI